MTRKMQNNKKNSHKQQQKWNENLINFGSFKKKKTLYIYRIIIVKQFLVCNNVNQTFVVLYDDDRQKRKKPMARKCSIENQYQSLCRKTMNILPIDITAMYDDTSFQPFKTTKYWNSEWQL